MHRQSLGSPAVKQPPPAARGEEEDDDDGKRKWRKKSVAGMGDMEEARQEGETKSEKSFRRSSVGAAASLPSAAISAGLERSIHVIPLLTFFCFLILYLCSHDPTATASADLRDLGVVRLLDIAASEAEIDRRGAVATATGGASTAAGNLRRLKELDRIRGPHVSRKMGRRGLQL